MLQYLLKVVYFQDKKDYEFTEYDKIITQTENEFTEKQLKHKKILEQLTIANQQLDNSRAQLEENQINIATLKAMIDIRRGLSVPQLKENFIQIYGDGTDPNKKYLIQEINLMQRQLLPAIAARETLGRSCVSKE